MLLLIPLILLGLQYIVNTVCFLSHAKGWVDVGGYTRVFPPVCWTCMGFFFFFMAKKVWLCSRKVCPYRNNSCKFNLSAWSPSPEPVNCAETLSAVPISISFPNVPHGKYCTYALGRRYELSLLCWRPPCAYWFRLKLNFRIRIDSIRKELAGSITKLHY